jgi:signal transduction histidine kinase
MEQLLERLRHLSKPHDRYHKPIDVREPIQNALDSLRAAFDSRELTVTSSLGGEQRIIVGDHNDLESLFLNLLINAQESTPPGGSVAVELNSDDGMIAVTVSDTGPGIPVDSLERIFDPFVTTKTRGSGLGLALCAGIAQGHGARITAANRTGGGAVFTVEFPLASKVTSPVLR